VILRSSLAFALACAACSSSPVGVGDQFVLTPGQSATIAEANLSVRFLGVPTDSRCPSDVVCIWPGDATVLLEVAPLNGDSKTDSLHTAVGYPQSIRLAEIELQLVSLEPYPRTSAAIPRGGYVVTLVTHRTPS
jgi:hypothetical protein